MDKDNKKNSKFSDLRKRAEALVSKSEERIADMSAEDIKKLVHELHTHQVELEIQNEDLRKAYISVENLRENYHELFDLAPCGYIKLNQKGCIIKANSTAAEMLAIDKTSLMNRKFTDFVIDEYQDEFYRIYSKYNEDSGRKSCEIKLKKGMQELWVHLDLRKIKRTGIDFDSYLITIYNINKQKKIQFFNDLSRNINDAIFFINPENSKFIDFNDQAIKSLGYTSKELLTMGMVDIETTISNNLLWRKLVKDVRKKGSFLIKGFHKCKDGAVFPVEVNITVANYLNREYIIATARDITERKKADKALILAEKQIENIREQLQSILNNIPEVVYSAKADSNRTILYISDSWEKWTGYSPEECYTNAEAWSESIHQEDLERLLLQYEQAILYEKEYTSEYRIINKKNGELRWIYDHGIPRRNENGVIIRYDGILTDISERKKVEKSLIESEKRFMDLLYASEDAILIIDNETFVDCNYSTVKMLRYKNKNELLMTHPSSLSPPFQPDGRASFEKAEDMMRTALHNGYHRFEWIHRKADRVDFPVEVSLTPMTLKGRTVIHCLWRDLSKHKEMEQMFIQSQKLQATGTLAGGMAHEFNNILGIIMGYAQILKESKGLTEEQNDEITEIYRQGEKAAEIIDNVLKFSRQEEIESEFIDLAVLLNNTFKIAKLILPHNIKLKSNIENNLPLIKGNPVQIQQALLNVYNNSIAAMEKKGGTLEITLGLDDSKVCENYFGHSIKKKYLKLCIKDEGCGITKEVLSQAFNPFFTTKEPGKGTGLGLSVVHGIVKAHKGEVTIKSEIEKGTTLCMFFPITLDYTKEDGDYISMMPSKGKERILIVDDESALIDVLNISLSKLGYRITATDKTVEALKIITDSPDSFDLIISDFAMPEMTGMQLYNNISKIKPNCRFIVISGYKDVKIDDFIRHNNNVLFLKKPLEIADLTHKIRSLLDK